MRAWTLRNNSKTASYPAIFDRLQVRLMHIKKLGLE